MRDTPHALSTNLCVYCRKSPSKRINEEVKRLAARAEKHSRFDIVVIYSQWSEAWSGTDWNRPTGLCLTAGMALRRLYDKAIAPEEWE